MSGVRRGLEEAQRSAVQEARIQMIHELRDAAGMDDCAMVLTPKQAWIEALNRVRMLRASVEIAKAVQK